MNEPLVFLPGLLCDAILWRHQLMSFSATHPLMVGNLTRQSSIEEQAGFVLDNAPPVFSLAGLSMGGYCALEIMRQAPQRVTRLALLDTSSRTDTAQQLERRLMLLELNEQQGIEPVCNRLLPLFINEKSRSVPALAQAVVNMMRRVGGAAFARQQQAIMGRSDSRPSLAAIHCPTLVVCGADDELTEVEVHREIAAGIPGSRLEIIDGCGHLSPLEKPAAVTGLMTEWLNL